MKRLYKGHRGPGIGPLKADHPELRDGDGDSVVDERLPRKTDSYGPSPLPMDGDQRGGPERVSDASIEDRPPLQADNGDTSPFPMGDDQHVQDVVEQDQESASTEPVEVRPVETPAVAQEPTRLSDRYAAIRDSLRDRGERLAANLQPRAERLAADLRARGRGLATNIRPAAARLAERAGHLQPAVGIATEEYERGKPKPKPKMKPKPVHPRMAELNDKYRRIRDVFQQTSSAAPPRRLNRTRSASNLKTPARGPGIKIVDKE